MNRIQDTICQAIKLQGAEILKKPEKFCNILEDLSPELSEERRFICRIYSEDLGKLLYNTYISEGDNKQRTMQETRKWLTDNEGRSTKYVEDFFIYFGKCFDSSIHDIERIAQTENIQKNESKCNTNQLNHSTNNYITHQPVAKKEKAFFLRNSLTVLAILAMIVVAGLAGRRLLFSGKGSSESRGSNSFDNPIDSNNGESIEDIDTGIEDEIDDTGLGAVRGVVWDEATRESMDNVTVYIRERDGDKIYQTKTDNEGKFIFSGLGIGDYVLEFNQEGYLRKEESISVSEGEYLYTGGLQALTTSVAVTEDPVDYALSNTTNEYILPNSDREYLTYDDLAGFSAEQCRLARNELFARHGRKFNDEGLQAYFNSCSWYHGTIEPEVFNESVFNKYEVANRDLIVNYEYDMGYR